MIVDTIRFGPLEVADDHALDVPDGIPGFPALRRVTMLGAGGVPGHEPEPEQPTMFWLQDLDDGSLAFLCIEPWEPFPDYDLEIDDEALGIGDVDNVAVLALVTVRRDDGTTAMTANLRAPLVIDIANRRVHQVILTDEHWAVNATFAVSRSLLGSDPSEERG